MRSRNAHQFVVRRRRYAARRTQKCPDEPAAFPRRVRLDSHLALEERVRGLRRHIDAVAGAIEFPAVIDATQTALFVAPEEQRRAPVRAVRGDETDFAVRITEGNE